MEPLKGDPVRATAHDGSKRSDVLYLFVGTGDALRGAVWAHVLHGVRETADHELLFV